MSTVARDDTLQIDRLQVGAFGTNAYILTCRQTGDSVVIDAPGEAEKIMGQLRGTSPKYILLTHSHHDHTGALSQLRSGLGVPLAAHAADANRLSGPPEIMLKGGESIIFGNVRLAVLHTPGHTPGSLCFQTGEYLLSGDTIFPGGPGKTATPADFETIVESIKTRIMPLADDTRIFPGHGDGTVLKKEKELFTAFLSKGPVSGHCGDVTWVSG